MLFEVIKQASDLKRMQYERRLADKIKTEALHLDRLNQKRKASRLWDIASKLEVSTLKRIHP